MSLNQVPNVLPKTILEATSYSVSFYSNQIPVDANENISLSIHISASSSLTCVAKIQVSHDGETWFDLLGTELFIKQDGDYLWTLNDLKSIMQIRASVVISTGSAIFIIVYRGS